MQCGIHAVRMIEHVAGQKITAVAAVESGLGNPKTGELSMAASLSLRLESGGVASVVANYLNQPGSGVWGNEELRIFGTGAFLYTDIFTNQVCLVDRDCAKSPAAARRGIYSWSSITCAEKARAH